MYIMRVLLLLICKS